ncbi:MAG TPA: hypothetical protein VF194_09915 [Ferrovibrio sp.]|uniref:hypothetical protein n=1 Tax=Ferrovibrio sp. TaxID=1917215 RepID=UPI002ED1D3AA
MSLELDKLIWWEMPSYPIGVSFGKFLSCWRATAMSELMGLRAYGLQLVGRFGFLCQFALRVPRNSTMPDRRRLELSFTHKNRRTNEDFYLDQHQKIEIFVRRFFGQIAKLTLHDGSVVELESKLSVVPSFTLARRTYVFGGSNEGQTQFF